MVAVSLKKVMQALSQLVIAALLVESVWETLKMIWKDGKFSVNSLGALLMGVLVSIFAGLDLFSLVGIDMKVAILGQILTGIILSRGSNFIHDLLSKLNESRVSNKVE